jgi:hypothetical protein
VNEALDEKGAPTSSQLFEDGYAVVPGFSRILLPLSVSNSEIAV